MGWALGACQSWCLAGNANAAGPWAIFEVAGSRGLECGGCSQVGSLLNTNLKVELICPNVRILMGPGGDGAESWHL